MSWWQAAAEAADAVIGMYQRNTSDRKAGKTAYAENLQGIRGRMEAAKEFGLHPLTVMGANVSGSGAPMPVGTDFRGAIESATAAATNQRQWKQEMGMRQLQEQRMKSDMEGEAALRNAQIKHIEKQGSFIDEQIAASQEQRLRESSRSLVSTASNPEDLEKNNSHYVKSVPNEVTRHINGVAQGTQPGNEFFVDPASGRRIPVPFGYAKNAEPSEVFSMLREVSSHFGIPLDVLTGKVAIDKTKNWLYRRRAQNRYRNQQHKTGPSRRYVPGQSRP